MKTNQSLTTTNFIGYAQEEYENLKSATIIQYTIKGRFMSR